MNWAAENYIDRHNNIKRTLMPGNVQMKIKICVLHHLTSLQTPLP